MRGCRGEDGGATEQMAVLLRGIAADGVAVVMVEQDEKLAASLADTLPRMDHGVLVGAARPSDARTEI
jgi:ABC-type uncharacterized transport system ATPase subunit